MKKKGKINCIIGSSGSGKTILSYLLIGLLFVLICFEVRVYRLIAKGG